MRWCIGEVGGDQGATVGGVGEVVRAAGRSVDRRVIFDELCLARKSNTVLDRLVQAYCILGKQLHCLRRVGAEQWTIMIFE